ncbi:hypothetical protein [Chitinolyticbacter albus]|uniref:hypothetical protein n=1 Tax=Chitinolyticbacter albus TaxID=2961951 RepID=UPI00210B4F7F|nr:hypothetical protein [Chitinolyticbacter albus]
MTSRIKPLLISALFTLLAAGCTTIHQMDGTQMKIVTLPDGMSEEIANDMRAGEKVIFKIPKGQSVPVKVSIDLPTLKLENGTNNAVFAQDVFMIVSPTGLRISPDAQRWAAIEDFEAIKTLFELPPGRVAFGFHANKEEGTFFALQIESKR